MLKPAFILLLGTPLTAIAAQPAALSLEDTFDAYVQVILHGNQASKEALRKRNLLWEITDGTDVIVDPLDVLQLPKAACNGTAMELVARALEIRQKTLSCTITKETMHSTLHSHEGSAEFLQIPDSGTQASANLPLPGIALLQQVPPLDAWNTRIEAESVPAVAGIPTCDPGLG